MNNASFEEFRGKFFNAVSEAQHIVITSHMSPDDDSIASVLSVYVILSEKLPEKDIRIVYTGEKVERYSVFSHFEKIEWVDDVANHLREADVLIMLDSSSGYSRFSHVPEKLEAVPKTIVIDHHASALGNFTLSLVAPECTSNAEVIYRALVEEGAPISKDLAEFFLLGILGDTGNFLHIKPSQGHVFLIAKRLIEIVNVGIGEFRARYGGIPKPIFELIQVLMKNTAYQDISGWPAVQYTYLDRSVLEKGKYSDEEMSAASHLYLSSYLPRISGYTWGFVVTPRTDGTCRMSSRSQSVNVRLFHEALGIGSGHDRAAGGYFKLSEPSDCIAKVLEWMKANKPVMLQ